MKKKKIVIIIAALVLVGAVVAAVLIFMGKKGEEKPEATTAPVEVTVPVPEVYGLGTYSVPAFPVGKNMQVFYLVPSEAEAELPEPTDAPTAPPPTEEPAYVGTYPALTEPTEPAKSREHTQGTYRYTAVADLPDRLADYCRLLTRPEFGYLPVDEDYQEIEMPPIGPAGHLSLAVLVNLGTEEEPLPSLFSLYFWWQGEELLVTVSRVDGEIVPLPEPETEPDGTNPHKSPVTITEAIEIFSSRKPSELGLSGDSMKSYQVIILDGAVKVGQEVCMRVNLYEKSEEAGTNVISGMYLLSSTGDRIYKVALNGEISLVLENFR